MCVAAGAPALSITLESTPSLSHPSFSLVLSPPPPHFTLLHPFLLKVWGRLHDNGTHAVHRQRQGSGEVLQQELSRSYIKGTLTSPQGL